MEGEDDNTSGHGLERSASEGGDVEQDEEITATFLLRERGISSTPSHDSEEDRLAEIELDRLKRTNGEAAPLWAAEFGNMTAAGQAYPRRNIDTGEDERDKEILKETRKRLAKSREKMSQKYNKRWAVDVFEPGDLVTLKIPRENRTSTDSRRMFCFVVDRPFANTYELRCRHGILNRFYNTRVLGK
ncbi:MAG: hypothetical protein M1823_006389, partial [Watsoniomyces obsoletus]